MGFFNWDVSNIISAITAIFFSISANIGASNPVESFIGTTSTQVQVSDTDTLITTTTQDISHSSMAEFKSVSLKVTTSRLTTDFLDDDSAEQPERVVNGYPIYFPPIPKRDKGKPKAQSL